jgi:Trypsin
VILGEHRISTEKDCFDDLCADPIQNITGFKPEDLIKHPDYDLKTKLNNIALIRLPEPAKVHQNNIKPVCLPLTDELKELPERMTVIGFGQTESSTKISDILRRVTVPLVSRENCVADFKKKNYKVEIYDGQFCAGGK